MDYFLNDVSDPQYLTERAWYKSSHLISALVDIVYKVYKEEKRRIKYATNVYCPGGCTVSTDVFKEEYRAPGYKSYDILLYVDPMSSDRATMRYGYFKNKVKDCPKEVIGYIIIGRGYYHLFRGTQKEYIATSISKIFDGAFDERFNFPRKISKKIMEVLPTAESAMLTECDMSINDIKDRKIRQMLKKYNFKDPDTFVQESTDTPSIQLKLVQECGEFGTGNECGDSFESDDDDDSFKTFADNFSIDDDDSDDYDDDDDYPEDDDDFDLDDLDDDDECGDSFEFDDDDECGGYGDDFEDTEPADTKKVDRIDNTGINNNGDPPEKEESVLEHFSDLIDY